jgi:hypothetical protein
MSAPTDSLGLRPQERRILVGIAVALFAVLNLVLVFPHFKDYKKIRDQLDNTRRNIATNNLAIARDTNLVNGTAVKLALMEKEGGVGMVGSKEVALLDTVSSVARACGVLIQSATPATATVIGSAGESDKFFERKSARITVQATEDALVKFIYNVGNDPAMIRVWELQLNPLDKDRYKLNAVITLTADYQRTGVAAPASAATAAPAPGRGTNPAPARATPAGPATPPARSTPSGPARRNTPSGPGGRTGPTNTVSGPRPMPSLPSMPSLPIPGQ